MTIKELFETSETIAIHCDTKKKARKLLKAFDRENPSWRDEYSTGEKDWDEYKERTCYDNEFLCDSIENYEEYMITIIEFEDIELGLDLSQVSTDDLLKEIKRRIGKGKR